MTILKKHIIKLLMTMSLIIACAHTSTAQIKEIGDSCIIEKRHWYIKTNAIGWAMGISNVSFEFEVAKHLSFTIPMYYSGWDFPRHKTKFRTLAYQPELRYWWNHDGGLFAGLHFGIAWWDVAYGSKYRLQDHNGRRPAYGPGVSIGWRTMPKNSRLKFEFSLGAGYYHLYYDKFNNEKNGAKVGTRQRNLFLIDNATVSLVYTFRMYDKYRYK